MSLTINTTENSNVQLIHQLLLEGLVAPNMLAASKAQAILDHLNAEKLKVPNLENAFDIAGTGGDGLNTYNISTGTAILIASMGGIQVVKHGNRAVSSQCGSADVMEALNLPLSESVDSVLRQIEVSNFAFCYAPAFHPALSQLKSLRKTLGIKTIYNLLGPLLNPANVKYRMIGVSSENDLLLMVDLLKNMPDIFQNVLLYRGAEGMDEMNTLGSTRCVEVSAGEVVREYTLDPFKYGFKKACMEDLQGGDAQYNAQVLKAVLSGEHEDQSDQSALLDALLLNAASALYFCDLVETFEVGLTQTYDAIKTGLVKKYLEAL